jgi:hypothetical protein
MSDEETYLAVLKAAYDYDPQPDAEDEIAVKENQILLLLEKVDDEFSSHLPTFLSILLTSLSKLVESEGQTRRGRSSWSRPSCIRRTCP